MSYKSHSLWCRRTNARATTTSRLVQRGTTMVAAHNARHILSAVVLGGAVLLAPAGASAQTLEKIKARGTVACGVNPNLQGFSTRDAKGAWTGFDVDLCRALAAAIFNDPSKVEFTPLGTAERLQALQSEKIDVLSRNTTWTLSRETGMKLNFAAVTYYDGQGFLVRRGKNATSALELDGASVCVQKGTTSELNLADYFRANNMKYQLVTFPDGDQARAAYDDGKCSVLTSDTSQLFAERIRLKAPDDHVVL